MLQAMLVAFWIYHALSKVDIPLKILYKMCIRVMRFLIQYFMKLWKQLDIWCCSCPRTFIRIILLPPVLYVSLSLLPALSFCHECLTQWVLLIHPNLSALTLSAGIMIFSVSLWWTVNTMTWYLLCSESLFSPPRSLPLSTFPLCTMCSCRLELAFGFWKSQVL